MKEGAAPRCLTGLPPLSLPAAALLSALAHLALLIAVNHTVVPPVTALRLPAGMLEVDLVQAARPQPRKRSAPAPQRPAAAIRETRQDHAPAPGGTKTGAASSLPAAPPAAPETGSPSPLPAGLPHPPAPPPDALARAMTPLLYSQVMTATALRYFKTTHALVLARLAAALTPGLRQELAGERAIVTVLYTDKGGIGSLTVDAGNEKLRRTLESELPWQAIPAPGSFSLPYREMFFLISLEKGGINLRLSPSSPPRPAP